MIEERDIGVAMRDGARLAVEMYRPDAPVRYTVLSAAALQNKDIQGPDIADILAAQLAPERELTRGWLKASSRILDERRSTPWEPFHKLTRDAITPVPPGEIVEYKIQVLATANQLKAGHRICLDITSMDVPIGTEAMSDVEYIPYHVCSSKPATHKIYHDAERPSHLLLPIIPNRGSRVPSEPDPNEED